MKIPSVKGFHDVLPAESVRWTWLEQKGREVFGYYGFSELRIPIVERADLFQRSIGASTDIVEKEMYTFEDRDGTLLTLRPEGTASIVRAYVEHALQQREPVSKLFYLGPMFRRERPQKGRLRQFSQIGCEVIGRDDPAIDAEVLMLLHDLLGAFSVREPRIQINSLGCATCRPPYRAELQRFGSGCRDRLCENCQRRLETNPLRLLDCKVPECNAITSAAPVMVDHLCEPCATHFARVRQILDRESIRVELQPRMVRGLDYYCRTAFEVSAAGLGAQSAVGGGGRYDGLVKGLGGSDAAGIGFALGVERLLLSMPEEAGPAAQVPDVFVAPMGSIAEDEAISMAHRWRRAGERIEMASGDKSLKSQMRLADRSGAPFVLIVGETELAARAVTVRDMVRKRDFSCAIDFGASAEQMRTALARLADQTEERSA